MIEYPLSYGQRALWFVHQLDRSSAAYNVHIAFRIHSPLEIEALRSAFQAIIDRHAPLRSTFAERDGVPFQRVAETMEVAFSVHDASALDTTALRRRLLEEVHRPFDLERGPVFRVALFRTQDAYDLIVTAHHLVIDLWSTIILLEELAAYYSGITTPGTLALEYRDYVRWQSEMLHGDDGEHLFQYWHETLRGDLPVLDLPLDRPRPPVQTFRGRSRRFPIATHIHTGVRSLAREERSTQFAVLVAAFQAFLHRLTGQDEVLVGAPTAARSRTEWDALVGHFTNPVIMRANFVDNPTFRELCRRMGAAVVGAIEHQDFPFPLLVERLQIMRDPALSPLFQSMISFEKPHRAEGRNSPAFVFNGEPVRRLLGQLEIEPIPLLNDSSQFDLTLALRESEGNLFATLEYNTDLFNDSTIDRWINHFLFLLEGATKDPDIRVSALPLVEAKELVRLARHSESRSSSLHSAQLVGKAIAETARRQPNAVAVIDGPRSLSYGELRNQVENLSGRLSGLGLGRGDRVGLFAERSVDAVVTMLAILEAGAAWLPLDPSLPKVRLDTLIEDAKPRFVLAPSSLVGQAPGRAISLEVEAPFIPPSGSCSETPAYVMHTSGSTGKPKGVVVSNRALANYAVSAAARYELAPGDRVLHFASLAFDVGIEEIFPTLLAGATVVVRPPGDVPTIAEFDTLLREQQITVVNLPASYWHEWVAEIERGLEIAPHLRLVVVGSERLLPPSVSAWSQQVGSRVRLLNAYGTTETTITSTVYEVGASASRDAVEVAIGKPLEGVRVYVVDSQMQLLPVGVPGEALIGGASVALSYLNQPAETAERFIPDPFHENPGARCYRTGDRMRWRPDGNLEFLGRLDEQIKIRGFRVEPGEIEAALCRHPLVTDAAVVAQRVEGRTLLAAFITPKDIDVEHLKSILAERLPGYMSPSVFVPLHDLPRTASGKLDRQALPALVNGLAPTPRVGRPGSTRAELVLCRIWSDVLGVPNLGIDDNFFALGGDSILAIQVITRARREGMRLTVRQFLRHPTLSALAASAEDAGSALAEQGSVVGEAPLTPIQRWFVEQASPEPHHDNQAVLLELCGPPNVQALEAAIGQLIEHHDALRLRLIGDKQRFVAPQGAVPFKRVVLDDDGAFEEAAAGVQTSLDLTSGPVFRAVLFEHPGTQARLLLCAHHLSVDGVSWRILLEDLAAAYQSQILGESAVLPPKTTSFKCWAERLFEYAQSKQLHAESDRWLDARLLAACHAPTDPGLEGEAQSVVVSLSSAETQTLLQTVSAAHGARIDGVRIDDMLLAALGKALEEVKPGPWLVDVEGHGREELFDDVDLSRTVGWFTTIYPILIEPGADPVMVRDARRNLRHGGIDYGVLRHLSGRSELGAIRPDVCFNYLGQFDQALSNGGPFKRAGEALGAFRSPRARRSHSLEINALVSDSCFSVTFTHVESQHSHAVVERLATTFLKTLRELPRAPLPGRNGTVEDVYPLTTMQAGMLFHTLLDSGSAYVEQMSWKVTRLDVPAFRQAWDALIARHAILRSAMILQDGEQMQAVYRDARPRWDLIDLREFSSEEKRRRVDDILRADRAREFELERAPLLRLSLLRTAEDEHIFIFSHHHILFDGWSMPLLLDEVLALYKAARDGGSPELQAVTPFRNYVEWVAQQDPTEWRDFFREALQDFSCATKLPLPFEHHAAEPGEILDDNYARKIRELDSSASAALDAFARRHALTPATLFRAAWALLLARYSGETDVLFGSVTSGRSPDLPGAETMVGLFINTLPLRVRVPIDAPLLPWLAQLQELQFELLRHQHAPLAEISALTKLPSGQPLFETILVYENYPLSGQLFERMESLGMSELRAWDKTNYPLTLAVTPGPHPMLQVVYDRRRYSAFAIEKLLGHLITVLGSLPQNDERTLGELSLLDGVESRELLDRNAAARSTYPERTLPQLFAERAALRLHAPALSYEGRQMSYMELASRARGWAGRLAEFGIADEALVGIYLERSHEAIIAMLATLETGGAYLPLDPTYPKERLAFMIKDAGVRVIITDQRLRERLPDCDAEVLLADDLPSADTGDRFLPDVCDPDRLAYVMYTSGSTGLPKAVEVTHRGIVRLVSSGLFALDEDDIELQLVSLSFDPSALEIWSCLLGGGKLVLCPSRNPSLEEIGDALREHRITSTILITGLFPLMVDEHLDDLVGLRQLIVGGDVMPPGAAQKLLQAAPGLRLINAYGPTEGSIVAAAHVMTEPDQISTPIPIGRPAANARIYLLDSARQLVPDGLPGEIWIGGDGVARGYRARPDLTMQRFADDPFSKRAGARMYRTGDLGRWRRDGSIEFLGRLDAQVKVRGFRVEPGEIEAVLGQHPDIRECAVIAYESAPGDRRLAAYVVPRMGESLQGSQLRSYLKSRLPEFMVPSTFTLLQELPRTVNDKVERSLLPKPGAGPSPKVERTVPSTTVEKEIQAIWIEVLRTPNVGIDEDFFEAGGHSLLALQTVSRLHARFGQLVRLGDLYQTRTIRSLSALIEKSIEKNMVGGIA